MRPKDFVRFILLFVFFQCYIYKIQASIVIVNSLLFPFTWFFFSLQMITGGVFLKGVLDMARYVASPVHFYVYDYVNEQSMNAFFGPCPRHLGVTHGDEMISLFDLTGQPLADRDREVSRLMVDIWTNFASTEYESSSRLPSF